MDITPDPHVLESKEADKLGWHDALAEVIDNSFDANATRVEIAITGRKCSVKDDGCGIEDIASAIRLGGHKRRKSTVLGRYGVGLKDAWMFLSHHIAIDTVRCGTRTQLAMTPADVKLVDGRWIAPDPFTVPSDAPAGTLVEFDPLRPDRAKPNKETFDRLAWTFMPAIESGRQIVRTLSGSRKPLPVTTLPATTEAIEATVSANGKQAKLLCGIMADGERNPYPGLWVCYGHRIIAATTLGCGPYSSSRIAGTIRLGSEWRLTPHKNDLAELLDELDAALFAAMEPLLKKADKLSEDINSRKLRTFIETAVNAALADARAKERRNGKQNGSGTVAPKATQRRRRHAEKFDITQLGSVETPDGAGTIRRRGVQLDWCSLDPDAIGKYDSLGKKVILNADNPFVAHAKKTANREALYAVAMGLLCHHDSMNEGKQRLLVERRDFIASWGSIMASLKFEEKKRGK
jgi:hypothetical protein